jgi:hypothetical protein
MNTKGLSTLDLISSTTKKLFLGVLFHFIL